VLIKGKERKKLFLSPEGQNQHLQHVDSADDTDSINSSGAGNSVLSEVLAISLGLSNDCPGMLPEQKVGYLSTTLLSLSPICLTVKAQ